MGRKRPIAQWRRAVLMVLTEAIENEPKQVAKRALERVYDSVRGMRVLYKGRRQ